MNLLRSLYLILPLVLTATPQMARLEVEVRTAGQTVPAARVYLTSAKGPVPAPAGTIAYDRGDEHHFVARGRFAADLEPGRYALTVERGPEFLPATRGFDIAAGAARRETVEVARWIDCNRRGWYSGDLHNHRKVEEMPRLLLAEDLNVAPTLTDWIWDDRPRTAPPETGEAVRQVDATHVFSVLDKEVERLEYGPGAVDLLGLRAPIPFSGYRLYPPSSEFCDLAHARGGYVDAEKILWQDVAALVALWHVDFAGLVHNHFNRHGVLLETDRWGMTPKYRPEYETVAGMPLWAMDVYYRFLNCGFRLPASAGSASGVMASPLGYNRVYVRLDGPFGYDRWFAALKQGRSFATNGPMLFLDVAGLEPGATVRIPARGRRTVRVRAEARSARPLERLEIVDRGQIVRTVQGGPMATRLAVDFEADVATTGWIAARCFEPAGRTIRFAHTSPVYVEGPGSPPRRREDARFFVEWIDRAFEHYRIEPRFRAPEHRDAMLGLFRKARAVYARLSEE